MQQFEMVQQFGKDGMDAAVKSLGAVTKGLQSTALEAADFAKRSLEQGVSTVEKLAGVRTLDKAMEIQGEYLRSAYEGFVSQATKVGEIATATAKDAAAPFEGLVAKARQTA